MIPIPAVVRVWLATSLTDMRRGMNGLALQVQEAFGRDPDDGEDVAATYQGALA